MSEVETSAMGAIEGGQQELSPPSEARQVSLVVIPLKELSSVARILVKLFAHVVGDAEPLAWSMHWALQVEEVYFELQRFPTRPFTRLRRSSWTPSKRKAIVHSTKIGTTSQNDADIEALGTELFARNWLMPYDLVINNCQTFVQMLAWKLCPAGNAQGYLAMPISYAIATFASRLYRLCVLPLWLVYYRCLGCEDRVLREFILLSDSWSFFLLPMLAVQVVGTQLIIKEQMRTLTQPSDAFVLITWIPMSYAMFCLFTYTSIAPMWLLAPKLEKSSTGVWGLQYRPNQITSSNAKGMVTTTVLGPEPNDGDRPHTEAAEDGRWYKKGEIPMMSPVIIVISVVIGLVQGTTFWLMYAWRRMNDPQWNQSASTKDVASLNSSVTISTQAIPSTSNETDTVG